MYNGQSLLFGPVIEKPNKTAFITEDPVDLILNGEFAKVPILATYTSDENLAGLLVDRFLIETGEKPVEYYTEPERVIPAILREKMDDRTLNIICSEMEKIYRNLEEKKYIVSVNIKKCTLITPTLHNSYRFLNVYLFFWNISLQVLNK